MKNKWIIVLTLLAILVINPTKNNNILNFIHKNDIKADSIEKINIDNEYNSVVYDGKVVYYDGKFVKGIDLEGKSIYEININSNNNILGSNKYIDILDKENNLIYSINKNGKIIFKKSVPRGGVLYKSLRDDLYLYAYKKDNKNILNIYDNEYSLINSIEIEGAITDIELFNNYIYMVELNTNEYLGSNIYKYDGNGNLKDSRAIKESIVLGLDITKDNMTIFTNNSIENIDDNLDIKNNKKVDNIEYYSNTHEGTIYVLDKDNGIKLISDKTKKINLEDISPKGIINNGENSIVYSDNNITTVKNKEVKNYDDDNIKRVDYIKDNIYLVSLENYIELIKVG